MTSVGIISIVILWTICGIYGYGAVLGDFWRFRTIGPSPNKFAIVIALSGPVGALTALLASEGHTLRWKTWRYEYCDDFTKQWLAERKGVSVEELR